MPGMGTGLGTANAVVVQAFRSALAHQALIVAVILLVAGAVAALLRAAGWPAAATAPAGREPAGRQVLRYGFGVLWVFDGLLQAQASMPLGMAPEVIRPTAAASPGWVQHVVNAAATIWSNHPVAAPASAVWIQVGIGLWLIVAPRGGWSRGAGAASVAWGLVVWVFGESFGGLFAPGVSWLFGAPGAVAFYCLAGVLIALPESVWDGPRTGRALLRGLGAFYLGMALLQAWPGRGFWQGRLGAHVPGTLAGMADQMSRTPQPRLLAHWVAAFARLATAHGWAVNLTVVLLLVAVGAGLAPRSRRLRLAAVALGLGLGAAVWVLVQDFGFLGGVGTDPNSMLPLGLLLVAGAIAARPAAAPATSPVGAPAATAPPAAAGAGTPATSPATAADSRWARLIGRSPARAMAALGAAGIILVGAAPMALASVDPNADPILAEALNGTPGQTDYPAPDVRLLDSAGHPVSLAGLRGRTVVFTFLDPVCVSDCPLIAAELRLADAMLGAERRRVELVAGVANPLYRAPAFVTAFDRQEGLDRLSNWLFLTGSLAQLRTAWHQFGYQVATLPGGAMLAHSDTVFVIDPAGRVRYIVDSNPGQGTAASQSSFAVELVGLLHHTMGS